MAAAQAKLRLVLTDNPSQVRDPPMTRRTVTVGVNPSALRRVASRAWQWLRLATSTSPTRIPAALAGLTHVRSGCTPCWTGRAGWRWRRPCSIWSRALHRETVLTPADLVWPLFVTAGTGIEEPVASLPGVSRWPVAQIGDRAREVAARRDAKSKLQEWAHAQGLPSPALGGVAWADALARVAASH